MNNPKQPSPQFEPKFKLGDPVRVISILGYIDEITEIIAVDKDDPNAPYKIDLLDREGCGIWCSEDAIALYDESKYCNLSQETANCDKSEGNKLKDKMTDQEFDLCQILKGCEGETIFLPDDGECKIVNVSEDTIKLTRNGNDTIELRGESLLLQRTGFAYAYPSKRAFLADPLNAEWVWKEWAEARTPKRWRANSGGTYWYVSVEGRVHCDAELECNIDNDRYSIGNYFRTREAAELAADLFKKFLQKFHEKNPAK